MTKHANDLNDCKKLDVPLNACALRFGTGESGGGAMLDYESVRGERLIVHFDQAGKLLEIELIGPGKPCQENP